MPPSLLFDISSIDLNAELFDQEGVRAINPQRGDMEHLNAIVWADTENRRIIGRKDVRSTEFWVPGHIPGRPNIASMVAHANKSPHKTLWRQPRTGLVPRAPPGGRCPRDRRRQLTPRTTLRGTIA